MKRHVLCLSFFLSVVVAGLSAAGEIRVHSGFNTNWWDSDANDRGSQTYVPVTIDAQHQDMSLKLLSAFAYTDGSPSDQADQTFSSVIDTKLNLSYQLVGRLPVDVLFGLDMNLPTGKTKLDFSELQLLRNPDLVTITRYGEGFNINPTLSVARQTERWAVGFGIGYLWRGEYDFSEEVRDYDPGDIFNLTAEAVFAFSERWEGRIFGEWAWYGTDALEVADYYREGDYLMGGFGIAYIAPRWETAFSAKGIFRGKSDFQEQNNELFTEEQNSYGDEYNAVLTGIYRLTPQTLFSSNLNYLFITENDYPSSSPLYCGEKQKISFGVSLQREFASQLTGSIGLSGYLLDEERNWYHDDDRVYRGFIADLSVIKVF